VVFSAFLFFFFLFPPSPLDAAVAFPSLFRQVFVGQSNNISYGKEEGKACVVCISIALLHFKEKT